MSRFRIGRAAGVLGALAGTFAAGTGVGRATADEAPPMFVAAFTRGPAWNAEIPTNQQPHFAAHSANLFRLRTEEKIVLGGRYADVGLMLLDATDSTAAAQLFAGDSAVTTGVFALEVTPWRPIFAGCAPGR